MRVRTKTGDTLVEVVLAIGIFSMVGIAAVAVISASSSGAENALEVTLARQAIDEQVEALRYIHTSLLVGVRSDISDSNKYRDLWDRITAGAVDVTSYERYKKFINDYASYSSCAEVYDTLREMSGQESGPFVINPRQMYLGDYGAEMPWKKQSMLGRVISEGVVSEGQAETVGKLAEAVTVPRLVYENSSDTIAGLNGTGSGLDKAEGVFIMAVRDQGTTTVVDTNPGETTTVNNSAAAFYDFYVRSCWFEAGADRPSTISTLVRLVDPTEVNTSLAVRRSNAVYYAGEGYFYDNPSTKTSTIQYSSIVGHSEDVYANTPAVPKRDGNYEFVGYTTNARGCELELGTPVNDATCPGLVRLQNDQIKVCDGGATCGEKNYYAAWRQVEFRRPPSDAR